MNAKRIIVIFKSNRTLKAENCFLDYSKDWWETDAIYKQWEQDAKDAPFSIVDKNDAGKIFDTSLSSDYDIDELKKMNWCIEMYLTQETHPEYFI